MGDGNDKSDIDVFEQLAEALEEREGSDRRKQDKGFDPTVGEDRRKGDRREKSK